MHFCTLPRKVIKRNSEAIPLATVSKRIKYVGINLPKEERPIL